MIDVHVLGLLIVEAWGPILKSSKSDLGLRFS